MYYPNNYDGYMQDYYFYNQNPNTYMNFNPNFIPNQTMNLSYYYPSLYKILMPVIIRVIQNSNFQYINEEVINNMVDNVYNIVEGEINTKSASQSDMQSNNSNNTNTTRPQESKTQNNELLKDIIKILVIKELQNRQIKQLNQTGFWERPF